MADGEINKIILCKFIIHIDGEKRKSGRMLLMEKFFHLPHTHTQIWHTSLPRTKALLNILRIIKIWSTSPFFRWRAQSKRIQFGGMLCDLTSRGARRYAKISLAKKPHKANDTARINGNGSKSYKNSFWFRFGACKCSLNVIWLPKKVDLFSENITWHLKSSFEKKLRMSLSNK